MKGYISMQSDDDHDDTGQDAASSTSSSPSSGFADALALIRLALDPAAMQAKLDQLMAATIKANEAKAAAAKAELKLAAAQAELDARETAIESRRAEFALRWSQLDADRQNLEIEKADLVGREDKLKHRMLRLLGRELHPMQSLPSYGSLEAELYGPRGKDPHFDLTADTEAPDTEPFDPLMAPERLPSNVTMTRSPRRSARSQA